MIKTVSMSTTKISKKQNKKAKQIKMTSLCKEFRRLGKNTSRNLRIKQINKK
jgi:hypothetical protein